MNGKVFIQTFGCQMNSADTDRMYALLSDQGFERASDWMSSDIFIINGCSVREKAVHKAVSSLGKIHSEKMKNSQGFGPRWIGVGGCVGQLNQKSLFSRAPFLDFVFGPDTIEQLPEILMRVQKGERKVLATQFDTLPGYHTETRVPEKQVSAFVNIMKGCDKFCTYCIVPFTRGREKSRKIDEVLDDVARLVQQGVREITFLGQNVNSFGKGNEDLVQRFPSELYNQIGPVGPRKGEENFPQLIRALEDDPRFEKLKRVRFTSSHPLDFSDQLLECYRDVSKLARHLHLPVQSGSNRILQKMGRHHKIETYIDQIQRLKKMAPDISVSTDLIVGFPTENEDDFQETLKLLEILQFDGIFAFAYSSRPGTRAAKMEDDVSVEVKKRRLAQLLEFQEKIATRRLQEQIGKTFEIFVEGKAKNQIHADQQEACTVWTGRSSCNRLVHFLSPSERDFSSQFLNVKITGATSLALYGELLVL